MMISDIFFLMGQILYHMDIKIYLNKISKYLIIMTDIKFATYPYTPIKNIKDDKRLQYIYMEQTLLKLNKRFIFFLKNCNKTVLHQ